MAQRADEDSYFELEQIMDKRLNEDGSVDYLVKWKGYSSAQSTWEPRDSLSYAETAVEDYEAQHRPPAKPAKRVAQKSVASEPCQSAAEELRIVGVRKTKTELMWAAEPVAGGVLVELTTKQAREKTPQALIDYLVANLKFAYTMSEPNFVKSEESKTLPQKGQTGASITARAAADLATIPIKEQGSVHSHHTSDIILTEDMSTTGSSRQQMTQTQGRSSKHASSAEEPKQRSVFAGDNEPEFAVLMDTMLGEGANGQVFRALDTHTGKFLAVKMIKMNLRSDRWRDKLTTLEKEIRLLRGLEHPNIVRYLGCGKELPETEPEGYVKIYMEYMAGGSISRLLKEFGAFEEPVVAKFTKQIVIGLQYLHGMGVMHRDLKGGNILVGPKGTVKLADFGASKQIQGLPIVSNNSEISKSIKGSLYWMAPEMFQKVPYGRKVDIWSLGCVVIEMATGKHPWPNIRMYQELCLAISQHQIPEIPEHVSQACKDFISLCLNYDKKLRPHPTALLRHPFLVHVQL